MAAEQPGVVQRHDNGHLPAQPRKSAEVEVVAMQIMAVDNLHRFWEEIKQLVGAWMSEVFSPPENIQPASGFCKNIQDFAYYARFIRACSPGIYLAGQFQ